MNVSNPIAKDFAMLQPLHVYPAWPRPRPGGGLPAALRIAGRGLWRLARWLERRAARPAPDGRIESRPLKGARGSACAVFLDGRLVGTIEGIDRL